MMVLKIFCLWNGMEGNVLLQGGTEGGELQLWEWDSGTLRTRGTQQKPAFARDSQDLVIKHCLDDTFSHVNVCR
jgi:hypothetical protein